MAYKIIDLPAVGRDMIGTDLFELSLAGGLGSKKITGAEIAAGVGAVTSVTATSPILSSGGLTPDISIPQATVSVSGYLSATDWSTFNGKQNSLTFGNLTETVSSVLTITGGTGAVIGSGASIQIKQSGAAQSGYLSSTDWNTFNNKKSTILITGNHGNINDFSNSGYSPGLTGGSTTNPNTNGFYIVSTWQTPSSINESDFIFNPFVLFGANINYKIVCIIQVQNWLNDGLHACITRKEQGTANILNLSGLTDFQGNTASNTIMTSTSDTFSSGAISTYYTLVPYFAAYNGGNGATPLTVTFKIYEV